MNEQAEIFATLEESKNIFNAGFTDLEFPKIQIGKFLPITNRGTVEDSGLAYGQTTGTLNVENGMINENTTSIELEGVSVSLERGAYLNFAKGAIYTELEHKRAKGLGLDIVAKKLKTVSENVLLIMQRLALAGHPVKTDITGLLNNKRVTTLDFSAKDIKEMKPKEVTDFFLLLMEFYNEQTKWLLFPDTIAIDARDLAYLSSYYEELSDGKTSQIALLENIENKLFKMAGHAVEIIAVPMGVAHNPTTSLSRIALYNKNEEVLFVDWAQAPTSSEPFRRSSLAYELVVQSQTTGAIIKELDQVLYVDYTSTVPRTLKDYLGDAKKIITKTAKTKEQKD